MTRSLFALSALTAPSQDSSGSCTAVLDPASQTGVHYDADGAVIAPSRMADGTGTATGQVRPDHDTD